MVPGTEPGSAAWTANTTYPRHWLSDPLKLFFLKTDFRRLAKNLGRQQRTHRALGSITNTAQSSSTRLSSEWESTELGVASGHCWVWPQKKSKADFRAQFNN